MKNAFDIVKYFEQSVADYCGSPYAVCVNSCTNALFLALRYQYMLDNTLARIEIPKHTYISVPMQIVHAGYDGVTFRDEVWNGIYKLEPLPIWDAARRFTSNMINSIDRGFSTDKYYVCVSFHWSKILGIQQGGSILHNDSEFDVWARKARFDGRTEGVKPKDDNPILGWHMYMSPEIAAEGLVRLMHLPKNNPDLPNDDYPDLSRLEIFK